MRLVVQRVNSAKCIIDNKEYSSIDKGFLVYIGITHTDDEILVRKYANKLKKLRVFEDNEEKMNLDISNIENASFLVISQFTLYADTKRSNRPSFIKASKPDHSENLYKIFIEELKKDYIVKTGIFGANMDIHSINHGPCTILYDTDID